MLQSYGDQESGGTLLPSVVKQRKVIINMGTKTIAGAEQRYSIGKATVN